MRGQDTSTACWWMVVGNGKEVVSVVRYSYDSWRPGSFMSKRKMSERPPARTRALAIARPRPVEVSFGIF